MTRRVYLVSEGEQYHDAWIPHAVFTDLDAAGAYATELKRAIAGQKWPNVYLTEFELNVPGGTLLPLTRPPTYTSEMP